MSFHATDHSLDPQLVRLHRGARTDEVPVAEHVVDPSDGDPVLVLAETLDRVGGLLPRVRAIPIVGDDILPCGFKSHFGY